MMNENSEFDNSLVGSNNSNYQPCFIEQIRQNVNPPINLLETKEAKHQRYTILIQAFKGLGELYFNKAQEAAIQNLDKVTL